MNKHINAIGIDVGFTIKGVRPENDKDKIAPESFRVISNMIKRGDSVYLLSKCNSTQKEHVEKWLSSTDFFNKTGVKPENLYFCFKRKDKSLFIRALGIGVMIDDRAEVMANTDYDVIKFLINPEPHELEKYRNQLCNVKVVSNWLEIEQSLF